MYDLSDKILLLISSYINTKTVPKDKVSASDRLSTAKIIDIYKSEARLKHFSSDYIKYLSNAQASEPLVVRHTLERAINEKINEFRERLSADYVDSYKEADKIINNRARLNQKVAIPTRIFAPWADGKSFRDRIETYKNNALEQLYSVLQEGSDESRLLIESEEILTQLAEQLSALYETESIYVKGLGVIDSCKDNKVEKYMFISKIDDKTSKLCESMNMAVFNVSDAKPLVNLPPLHPNCRSEIIPLQTITKSPELIFLTSGIGQAQNSAPKNAGNIRNPIMLEYALKQIGAGVKELYNPFDESDVVIYYVRYNGRYYNVPVLNYVNGQPIVDTQTLIDRLNLTDIKASKLSVGPGTKFNTMNEAAIAFQLTYGLDSNDSGFAAIIYRTTDGKYSYTFGGHFPNGLDTSEIYTGEVNDRNGAAMAYVYDSGKDIINNSALPIYYVEDKRLLLDSGKGVKEIADLSGLERVRDDEGQTLVTKNQLIATGWNKNTVNDTMIADLNRVLTKYEINTPERISHFIAQCLHESGKGLYTFEQGSESYFSNMAYGSKYRGVGYIQITWEYSYQAFATYLVLQAYPELFSYAAFRSPDNNDANTINNEYKNLLNGAKALGLDISTYTNIVDKGYVFVSNNFAWESAGYYWTIRQLNSLVDSGASVDDISRKINFWDTATFQKRKAFYDDIIKSGVFK